MPARAALELDTLTIHIPIRLQRRGGRKLIMMPEGVAAPARKPSRDETLVKALVRAHRWRRRIESGQAKSITDLAEQEGVTDAYVCRLLPLTCLAPDIVEVVLDGRQSKGLRLATEHKRAQQVLLESEERFRNLANTVPDIVWTAAPDGTITFANDRWLRFCGITPEQNARDWPELVLHPDDRARCIERWNLALREGTEYEIEVRNRRHDGEYRWFLTRAAPIRNAEGRVTAWIGSTTDIHDRKQAEQHHRMLTAELSHRVKNILTVVQVLAERSGSKATSVAGCLAAFRGRLQALSAAHNILLAGDWKWASLTSLIRTALEPYLGDGDRIQLDIHDLGLEPEAALTLALGFHELATNAAKYGALSSPGGRIFLSTHVHSGETGQELRIVWQESGGPAVEPPAVAGFGTTMLSRAIEYQHEGRAELDWRKEGLVCRLALPLTSATSLPEAQPRDHGTPAA